MASSSITMPIINGQIPDASQMSSTSESDAKTKVQQNKDMFLQLLVAEMQFQDPLEPTDNSEYIQQLYSMSQTESVLQVQEDMSNMTARNLVGKYISVQDPTTGEYAEGKVDSVVEVGGVLKLSMNGEVYELSQVKQVHDEEYFIAASSADTLTGLVNELPEVENLRIGQKEDLQKAVDLYNAMDDYAKGFLKAETVKKLTDLVAQMNILVKKQEGTAEETPKDEASESEAGTVEKTEASAGADTEAAAGGATDTPASEDTETKAATDAE